jgi:hypothetical protein
LVITQPVSVWIKVIVTIADLFHGVRAAFGAQFLSEQ